jgi:hypothetical protein
MLKVEMIIEEFGIDREHVIQDQEPEETLPARKKSESRTHQTAVLWICFDRAPRAVSLGARLPRSSLPIDGGRFSGIIIMINLRNLATMAGLITSTATVAAAQDLSALLPNMLRDTVVLAPPPAGSGFASHEAHFLANPGDPAYEAPTQFNAALVTALTTFPVGSSSGGFVFEGDPAVGDFRPASRTYGPLFAERALTAGKGTLTFSMNYQGARFDEFDGKELDAGDITFYLPHIDTPALGQFPNPFFEGDLIETSVSMKVSTDTTAFLLNYGLTDRWDIGAAVPIQHVSLTATVRARVDRAATGATAPGIHTFEGASPNERLSTQSDSATGLGDILLRSKYRMWKAQGGGLAMGLDLRVPTGREEDLLGLGTTQAKVTLIGSKEFTNGFAPHFNLSYTFSGDGSLPDVQIAKELGYVFGAEVAMGRVSFAGDLIGRTLIDAGRFADTTRTFPLQGGGSFQRTEFTRQDESLTQLIGAVGVKVLVASQFLLTGNVLFSINDAGLTARFVPVVGLEYAWAGR